MTRNEFFVHMDHIGNFDVMADDYELSKASFEDDKEFQAIWSTYVLSHDKLQQYYQAYVDNLFSEEDNFDGAS